MTTTIKDLIASGRLTLDTVVVGDIPMTADGVIIGDEATILYWNDNGVVRAGGGGIEISCMFADPDCDGRYLSPNDPSVVCYHSKEAADAAAAATAARVRGG